MATLSLRPATLADVDTISALAEKAWWQHYPSIISGEQIRYMLARGYSPDSLRQQMTARSQRFLLAELDGVPVAYSGWSIKTDGKETWLYLNKLYAIQEAHGTGAGRLLLDQVRAEAKLRGLGSIRLNVNKYNATVAWYLRRGFTVRQEMVLDIGNGFVMDDYVLELAVV